MSMVPGGALAMHWLLSTTGPPQLDLCWVETGGPPVAGAPARSGFGSRVLDGTVRRQLGGRITLRWEATGLVCALEIPLTQANGPAGRAGDTERVVSDVNRVRIVEAQAV
jgi:two-component sensor histidine kinase